MSTLIRYIAIICDIGFSLCQAILFLILGRSETFVSILGFVALGLESTLPIPQLLRSVTVIFVIEYTPHTIFALATIDSGRYMAFECQPLSVGSEEIRSSEHLVDNIPIFYSHLLRSGPSTSLSRIIRYSLRSAPSSSYLSIWVRNFAFRFKYYTIQLGYIVAIVSQRCRYGAAPPFSVLAGDDDDLEQALALGED